MHANLMTLIGAHVKKLVLPLILYCDMQWLVHLQSQAIAFSQSTTSCPTQLNPLHPLRAIIKKSTVYLYNSSNIFQHALQDSRPLRFR